MPDPLFATESIWGTQYIIPPMAERQKRAGQEVRPPESTREENIRAPAEAMREEEERARERLLHDEEINHRDKEQNTSASVPEKRETHTRHSRATLHALRMNIARDNINVQKLSPAELQRAVILSEILSAPRSLKSLHFD